MSAATPVSAALPPFPVALLMATGDRHIEALRAWGCRIGLAAREALAAADDIERTVGDREARVRAVSVHFGLANAHHCLHVEPLEWLRLNETQATKGLKHFLAFDDERIGCFLRALAPSIVWPLDLEDLSVAAEVRSGRGRIDLLVQGRARHRAWGAVVEAKFEHGLGTNPLSVYKRHAVNLRMTVAADGSAERTGALIVVGKRRCRQTRRKLSRNENWRFVHWHEVLRRFDAALTEPKVDEDFRRFRRTLWERAGER